MRIACKQQGMTAMSTWLAVLLLMGLATGVAHAHGQGGNNYDRGAYGMMGGQGMMGPGMMGPGMMGPGMMGQGMMGPGMTGAMGPYMEGVLGLSEEQRQRVEALRRERAGDHWQLMQQMFQHRQDMVRLQGESAPDVDEMLAAHERMSELQREMMLMHLEMRREMRGILNEEQRSRLDEMHQMYRPAQ